VIYCLLALIDVPPLQGRVNDLAHALEDPAALEQALAGYEQKTGHQFAFLSLPSTAGEDIAAFSMRVLERWKLGSAERDDGVLLTLATEDRAVRIEVGYGLEGAVPDALAARVVREVMLPRFRASDIDGGVTAAFDILMRAANGEAVRIDETAGNRRKSPFQLVGPALAFLFLAGGALRSRGARALVAGTVGLGLGWLVHGFLAALACAALFGLLGLLPRSALAAGRWMGGRGSSGFGGGGFSGMGGGFGGGGASGRW
jgi:uncharacterized protein